MAAEKDRITCHILDTSVGQPARGVRVKLELLAVTPSASANSTDAPSGPGASDTSLPSATLHAGNVTAVLPSKIFESQTDEDGRIKAWLPYSSPTSSGEVPVYTLEDVLGGVTGPSTWALKFDTGAYYGPDKTFFPEVTVAFRVDEGQHYHVPLLLAPYSYSTYRGS